MNRFRFQIPVSNISSQINTKLLLKLDFPNHKIPNLQFRKISFSKISLKRNIFFQITLKCNIKKLFVLTAILLNYSLCSSEIVIIIIKYPFAISNLCCIFIKNRLKLDFSNHEYQICIEQNIIFENLTQKENFILITLKCNWQQSILLFNVFQ